MKVPRRIAVALAGLALLAGAVYLSLPEWSGSGVESSAAPAVRELTRDQLELRDGRLFAKTESQPFQGRLIEDFAPGKRKLEIEIAAGKANGRSRGWYENGNREVDEIFVEGVSNGPRTRWHENGKVKSTTVIDQGKLGGDFTEWHDNGIKATEMTLRDDGKPDGEVTAWYPSGGLKSRLVFENGMEVSKQIFEDNVPVATVAEE